MALVRTPVGTPYPGSHDFVAHAPSVTLRGRAAKPCPQSPLRPRFHHRQGPETSCPPRGPGSDDCEDAGRHQNYYQVPRVRLSSPDALDNAQIALGAVTERAQRPRIPGRDRPAWHTQRKPPGHVSDGTRKSNMPWPWFLPKLRCERKRVDNPCRTVRRFTDPCNVCQMARRYLSHRRGIPAAREATPTTGQRVVSRHATPNDATPIFATCSFHV
jgi:hypothetical protein